MADNCPYPSRASLEAAMYWAARDAAAAATGAQESSDGKEPS